MSTMLFNFTPIWDNTVRETDGTTTNPHSGDIRVSLSIYHINIPDTRIAQHSETLDRR